MGSKFPDEIFEIILSHCGDKFLLTQYNLRLVAKRFQYLPRLKIRIAKWHDSFHGPMCEISINEIIIRDDFNRLKLAGHCEPPKLYSQLGHIRFRAVIFSPQRAAIRYYIPLRRAFLISEERQEIPYCIIDWLIAHKPLLSAENTEKNWQGAVGAYL